MAIALPPAANAERLTAALHAAGLDRATYVSEVAVVAAPVRKLRSHTYRLRPHYQGSTEGAPSTIILKTGHMGEAGKPTYLNASEIEFYRDVAPSLPRGFVPLCYQVVAATDNATWHLLLEDLTDTHFVATQWPIPPRIEQCEEIIRAMARIHAAWWDHGQLGTTLGRWPDEAIWSDRLRKFTATLDRFTSRFVDILPPERHEFYARLVDQAPRLLARYASQRNLTIVHGDAHFWNFFLPQPGIGNGVRLLDWEGWSIDTATADLAYMIAMLWYPDRRRYFEQRLLDCYHETLSACGIDGYDRASLNEDYRLSALWLTTRPIWQATAGIGGGVWWNNLERIFLAVEDLGCRELLD